MGLLPQIAHDLLPSAWTTSPDDAIAQAGVVIGAYALGVVVGAPTIAIFAARMPRRSILLGLAVLFTLGTVASALAPNFALVVLFRFLAALPHGAYFGIAALVAASLMGPGKRGQGVALVLSGLTVANVVGVPLITFLGQQAGWRAAYLVVAAIFAASVLAIRLTVPKQPGIRMRPRVASSVRSPARPSGSRCSPARWALPASSPSTATSPPHDGGHPAADRRGAVGARGARARHDARQPGRRLGGGSRRTPGALRELRGIRGHAARARAHRAGALGLFVFLFGVGAAAAALSPAIQTRLMDVAGESQTLAAAVNHSALNIGNALGAFLGGAVIAAGWGYLAPTWVGLLMCVPGVALALAGAAVSRRVPPPAIRSSPR
ncbi:hypothetical protein GCM10025869_26370 [Homoserinibacter gongjuensis]|uniref:Major facilitator superfamily (MFS) profile domain-containing protein n=1 Tax=Homoserinibacter gongjuensis TaxID=1162968 RepID=A0ABQ6JV89_9MICO|nr:hypothetical protein GCM10025869_26370 [Homoserinibacter gongjuensis]